METAVLVGVGWSHNTNLTKISLITTIIGINFTGMYIFLAKACGYVVQEGREKGLTKSSPTVSVHQPVGCCTEETHSAYCGWKRLSLFSSSPQSRWASHTLPTPL